MKRALAWARRWGISLASLIGGLSTLFVFATFIAVFLADRIFASEYPPNGSDFF